MLLNELKYLTSSNDEVAKILLLLKQLPVLEPS